MSRRGWMLLLGGGSAMLAGAAYATTRGKPRGLRHYVLSLFGQTKPRRRVNRAIDAHDWPQDVDDAKGWSEWSERQEAA